MHVVLTVNATWNAVNFRRSVIEALIAGGHRVTVLAPRDDQVRAVLAMGADHEHLEMDPAGLSPARDLAMGMRLWQHLRRLRPDIVLGYTIKNNVFGAMAARRLGIPFLPNVSGLGTGFLGGRALRRVSEGLYRTALRGLPAVFFQNPEDAALFVERGLATRSQVRLLPGSGIDLGHFRATPLPDRGHAPTFLFIGRILRDKGAREFADAARQVRRHYPAARFQMLGAVGAENRSAIGAEEVRAWTRSGIVDHLGTLADVRPAIAAADCIVLPSYREGAPRTLIEGGAMARPTIATDVAGCRYVVVHGRTGLLVPPRDAQALATAMARYIELPQRWRAAMGAAARQRMEEVFDQRFVVEAYQRAIGECADCGPVLVPLPGARARAPFRAGSAPHPSEAPRRSGNA